MKTSYTLFLFLSIFIFGSKASQASHLIVGEMTYKYLGADIYEFTVYYYRDCRPPSEGGGNPNALADDDPIYITTFKGNSFYDLDSVYATEKVVLPAISMGGCIGTNVNTCVNRAKFVFTKILPDHTLEYTILNQRCCMSGGIVNIINSGNNGYSFYCRIPPHSVGLNSSAVFQPVSDLRL